MVPPDKAKGAAAAAAHASRNVELLGGGLGKRNRTPPEPAQDLAHANEVRDGRQLLRHIAVHRRTLHVWNVHQRYLGLAETVTQAIALIREARHG